MSAENLQLYASLVGLLIAIIGLPMLIAQLRELQRSIRSGAHAAIYAQAADLRSYLIEYPHLRRYFFDGAEVAPDSEDYDRVVTIAELSLNYLEHIAVMEDSFGGRNRASLDRFTANAFARSPILRRHLAENGAAYSHALHRFAPDVDFAAARSTRE